MKMYGACFDQGHAPVGGIFALADAAQALGASPDPPGVVRVQEGCVKLTA